MEHKVETFMNERLQSFSYGWDGNGASIEHDLEIVQVIELEFPMFGIYFLHFVFCYVQFLFNFYNN